MFQQQKAWYAIYVSPRQEEKVKQRLEAELGDDFELVVPKRKLRERKGGQWRFVTRKLFPGYILFNGMLDIDTYYSIKRIPEVIRLLKDESTILTINEEELRVLNVLLGKTENTVEISTVLKEKDKVQVIEGPLMGLEGRIVSINARKGRAKVKLNLGSQEKVVELGITVVEKEQAE